MAVEAIVRRMLGGLRPQPGARAAVRELELEDYEPLFAARTIHTGIRDDAADGVTLYRQVLGASWAALPAAVRAMHDGATRAEGRAEVERGTGWLSRLVGALIGFPASGADVPLHVAFALADDGETWTRTFDDRSFSSRQFLGRGRWERLLCERFGPLTFAMALVPEDSRCISCCARWTVFGLPMPMWLCPRSASWEEG